MKDHGKNNFDVFAQLFADTSDHSKIEQTDRSIVGDDEVSRMRIGVIKAVPKNHVHENSRTQLCQLSQIMTGGHQLVRFGQTDSLQTVHRQHTLRGTFSVRPRDEDFIVVAFFGVRK